MKTSINLIIMMLATWGAMEFVNQVLGVPLLISWYTVVAANLATMIHLAIFVGGAKAK